MLETLVLLIMQVQIHSQGANATISSDDAAILAVIIAQSYQCGYIDGAQMMAADIAGEKIPEALRKRADANCKSIRATATGVRER